MNKKNIYPFQLLLSLFLSSGWLPADGHLNDHDLIRAGSLQPVLKSQRAQVPGKFTSNINFGFIENQGQITDQNGRARSDIDFQLSGKAMNIFVGAGQLHYQWSNKGEAINIYRMDVVLQGANKHSQIIKDEKQTYFEQYHLPNCGPMGAIAHSYKRIVYKDVYPKIDWVLYVNSNKVEYDFIVHPGGKVSDIRIEYKGATELKINTDRSLTATTPMGSITEQAPFSYDADNSIVSSAFVLNDRKLSFAVGAYKGKLTIDPTIEWATYFGGPEDETSPFISTDNQGNVFLAGSTTSISNIATTGGHQTALNTTGEGPFVDAYLVKYNSAGVPVWATYYGGIEADRAQAVACDKDGNVYLAGVTFTSANLATAGTYRNTLFGDGDVFLVKFNGQGVRQWGTYYGGPNTDEVLSVACDNDNNVYLTGNTRSTEDINTPGSYQDTLGGGSVDAFLVKFDATGNRVWSNYFGGEKADYGTAVSCDLFGNVYITGFTWSMTNITTAGIHQQTYDVSGPLIGRPPNQMRPSEAFLAKFTSAGVRKWATYYGGGHTENSNAVICDDSGNVFIAGQTYSGNGISTPGSFQPDTAGFMFGNSRAAFLAKFDSTGIRRWGTYYGGKATGAIGLGTNPQGDVYLLGFTTDATNISTAGTHQESLAGEQDNFVAKFDHAGARQWGTYYGGAEGEYLGSLSTDRRGMLYISAGTNSTSGIATSGGHQSALNGEMQDAYLVKFNDCPVISAITDITGADTVCENSSNTYTVASVAGATGYLWELPNGWTGTSTENAIAVTATDAGGVIKVSAYNYCDTSAVQTLDIFVADPMAIITVNGFELGTTSAFDSYQWYKDGQVINGATNATFIVTENGTYTVKGTDAHGCSDSSNAYQITNVSVGNVSAAATAIKIYPNPATSIVNVDIDGDIDVIIENIDGKVVLHQKEAKQIDISHLSAGIYLMNIIDKNGYLIKVEKLVKQFIK